MTIQTNTTPRRHDLDWLRVLAILSVFVFHSFRFFTHEDWHDTNTAHYAIVDVWITFLSNWMMPVIFVISGASVYYALSKGKVGKFLKV